MSNTLVRLGPLQNPPKAASKNVVSNEAAEWWMVVVWMWRLQSKALILSNYWSPWIFPTTSSSNPRMVGLLQTFVGYNPKKSTWNRNIKALEDAFPFQLGWFLYICVFAPENSNGWKAISEFQARRFLLIFLGVGGPNEYRFKKSLIGFEESHRFSSYHPKNTYEKYTVGRYWSGMMKNICYSSTSIRSSMLLRPPQFWRLWT